MKQHELIPHLFRTEYAKITAVLCRTFGLTNIELAEDITSDTFLLATETWGLKGIPENPQAWLYTVAKNKTKDYLKRNTIFSQKIENELKNQPITQEIEIDLSEPNITDAQLQMLFAICHPSLAAESQVALGLRILCGFGVDEIADAFITNKETINKRLFRAKEKLRSENIRITFPSSTELDGRLHNVLLILYLLFNEGYYSASNNNVLRKDFCLEAMRLTYLLVENDKTNLPKVKALLSLMCFHTSRFEARLNQHGGFILYEEQNQQLWNSDLISMGTYYLNLSTEGNEISKYHLEAIIAYWHTQPEDSADKWKRILQMYNELVQIEYSPFILMNRIYALSKVHGKLEAIQEAEKIDVKRNHLFHTLLANLYTGVDNRKAKLHYEDALTLAKTDNDKNTIVRCLNKIEADVF